MFVPENSLPAEVSETQLSVQVSLSGPYQMPSNYELVSAVYWVSSRHKFIKPITVEIQHCAALSSDKQCSQLTFVHTKCTQKELPYIFKEQVGGIFSPHSSYGSLSLSHFSGIGVVIMKPPLQRSFRVQPVQPFPVQAIRVQPASSRIINLELGQRQQQQQQQPSESSGQAIGSEQQQTLGQAIDSEQKQQTFESSGQANDSEQQKQTFGSEQLQQKLLPESSGQGNDSEQKQQTFGSEQLQQKLLPESSGQANDSEQQQQTFGSEQLQQKLLPESSGQGNDSEQKQQTFGSEQLQQKLLPESSGQAIDSQLGQPQYRSSSQNDATCQTAQEQEKNGEVFEQYRAQLYITCKLVNEWKVDFVVTKDLDSCSTVSGSTNLCRLSACFTCT